MTWNNLLTTCDGTTTDILNLDHLARRAPATNDLLEMADWLATNGPTHLSTIARIELAERLITRRRFLIGAGAFGLGVITGCGGQPTAENAPEPTECEVGFRLFTDAFDQTVCVPDVAERIVALHDFNAAAQLLSLGAPVVGMPNRGGEFAEGIARFFDLSDITDIGSGGEPNIETIVSLNPDLMVIGTDIGGEMYLSDVTLQNLRAIAPLVIIKPFRPVEEIMADYDELLGEAATISLEEQQAAFETKLEELRSVFGEDWENVTVSRPAISNDSTLMASYPTELTSLDVLTRVGATWAPIHMEAGEIGNRIRGISLEEIDRFRSDLVLMEPTLDAFDPLENVLVQQLPAVKAGQVIYIESSIAGGFYPAYTAMVEEMLEDLRAIEDFNIDLVEEDASN